MNWIFDNRVWLTAIFLLCLHADAASAQSPRPHPARLAVELMSGTFHLWGPPYVQRGFANVAVAGGAGLGTLLQEEVYLGMRATFGEFDRDNTRRESGGDLYLIGGEAIAKILVPRGGATEWMQIGPVVIRPALLLRSGVHVVGRRAGEHESHRGCCIDTEQNSETRFSLGGGGGVEFRLGQQAAIFVDATYSLVYEDEWLTYTPILVGLRLAGGPP